MKKFEMTDLDHVTYIIGIEFHKTSKWLLMHQKRYTLEILKKFEMKHYNPATKPIEPRLQLSK